MAVQTIPRSWKKMFGTNNPNDINDMFMTISAYAPPQIDIIAKDVSKIYDFSATGGNPIESFRIYYPRDNIQEQIKHNYGESNSKAAEMLSEVRGGITRNITGIAQATSKGTKGALMEEPHIYTNSERRTFSVNIPLVAYDDLQKDIYDLTKFFRRRSYPRRGETLNTIQYPNVFKIRGGLFDTNQPTINNRYGSFFVLEDFTIDYNPEVKLMRDGFPMQATLTLGLTELNLVFANDFDASPANISISQTSKKPDVANTLSKSTLGRTGKDTRFAEPTIGQDFSIESNSSSAFGSVQKYVKKSKLVQKAVNLADPAYVEEELKSRAEQMVKDSAAFKRVTGLVDIDPEHRLEIFNILKKLRF